MLSCVSEIRYYCNDKKIDYVVSPDDGGLERARELSGFLNAKSAKNWTNRFDESKAYTWAGAGQAVGPVVAASLGVLIYHFFGWPGPFIFFGAIGLLFAVIWYYYVRDTPDVHKGVNAEELAYINEGKTDAEKSTKKPTIRPVSTAAV